MRREIRSTVNTNNGSNGGNQTQTSPMKQVQTAPPITAQENSVDPNRMHIERRNNDGTRKTK